MTKYDGVFALQFNYLTDHTKYTPWPQKRKREQSSKTTLHKSHCNRLPVFDLFPHHPCQVVGGRLRLAFVRDDETSILPLWSGPEHTMITVTFVLVMLTG